MCVDMRLQSQGSIALMRAESAAGQEWLDAAVDALLATWRHGSIIVESRLALDIADAAEEDGLTIAWT